MKCRFLKKNKTYLLTLVMARWINSHHRLYSQGTRTSEPEEYRVSTYLFLNTIYKSEFCINSSQNYYGMDNDILTI